MRFAVTVLALVCMPAYSAQARLAPTPTPPPVSALPVSPAEAPPTSLLSDPNYFWRVHSESIPAERRVAQRRLTSGNGGGGAIIQASCTAGCDQDMRNEATARQCDWRAIVAGEDEIMAMLVHLRGNLGEDNLKNLPDSEAALETSMLTDVGLGMDYCTGSSITGPIGALIRARAAAQRAAHLYEIQQKVDA